jgi:prepilin-type N-terminal cleavage/methylation domain-containing protein
VARRPSGRRRGFSLFELLAALVVLVALAGILLPLGRRSPDDARRERALGDLLRIAAAARGLPPLDSPEVWTAGAESVVGAPRPHRALETPIAVGESSDVSPRDPWGAPWVVFTASSDGFGLALSAGPDRRLQTRPGDARARGDDLCVPFRPEGRTP